MADVEKQPDQNGSTTEQKEVQQFQIDDKPKKSNETEGEYDPYEARNVQHPTS